MTAAQSDRTSFGCGHQSDATYFGEALFGEGLAKSDSLLAAFEIAKQRVAEREAAAGSSRRRIRRSVRRRRRWRTS